MKRRFTFKGKLMIRAYKAALFCFLVLISFSKAYTQNREVKVLFDSSDIKIKERYFVLENRPQVLDSTYVEYYINGKVKVKGQYDKNVAIGLWEYYYENGIKSMSAELNKDGRGQDYWTYYFENGQVSSEGNLDNGKKNGLWRFYYENGELKSQGYYADNKREGNWNIYYEEEKTIKAQAVYDGDIGWYQEFYPEGELKMEGKIVNGKSDSLWTQYYPNGKIKAQGIEENGLKNGDWKFYHSNGELESEGKFQDGVKNGPWKEYFSNGAISSEGNLYEGQKDGFWKLYYKNGASKAEGTYEKGTGKYTEFYESGKLKVSGYIENGKNDSTWRFYYEDGSIEGTCNYDDGIGEYKGYYKNGRLKMKGQLEEGEKTGTWKLYDEKGKLAGLYKTYYDDKEPVVIEPKETEFSNERISNNESTKPSYKFKQKKRIKYFEPVLNEYKSFILSANPLLVLFGSFPVALEYYYQERLGYEIKVSWLRDPFFVLHRDVPSDIPFQNGFYIELRQKFYFEKNVYGLLYFGHEFRYTRSSYGCNLSTPIPFFKPVLNEDLFDYSIVFGDRVMESHANKGFTLDVWGGVGAGYRIIDKNWTNIPSVERAYSDINTNQLNIPIRLGFTVGYVFKYNPSPLYN